jgi:hypothetical protein
MEKIRNLSKSRKFTQNGKKYMNIMQINYVPYRKGGIPWKHILFDTVE